MDSSGTSGRNGELCVLVNGESTYEGKQGHTTFMGVSAQTTGSRGLCLHALDIPPGGRDKPHLHEEHESAVYVISGTAGVWHGPGLTEYFVVRAGEFVYVPAGVAHMPMNLSDSDNLRAVVARTDPNEQESVVVLPVPEHID